VSGFQTLTKCIKTAPEKRLQHKKWHLFVKPKQPWMMTAKLMTHRSARIDISYNQAHCVLMPQIQHYMWHKAGYDFLAILKRKLDVVI